MRPDIEDYDELGVAADDAPRSRAMSWLVLVIAVGGFAALAYYAYHAGTHAARDGEMLVVQADDAPIKETPADPEGEQFANKDKTIYDVISPSGNTAAPVEKLLPDPEKPVADAHDKYVEQAAAGDETSAPAATTYVNKDLRKASTAVDPVDEQSLKQPAVAAAPAPKAEPQPAARAEVKPPAPLVTKAEPQPVAEAKTQQAAETIGAPTFVNESPAGAKKPASAETPAKKEEPAQKPAAKAAEKPAAKKPVAKSGGAYQVQLGAFKSDAEARAAWKKISAKHAGVLTGSPVVVKADLPGGTFYRLRTAGFASADAAKAACTKLSAAGQACMPVGK